MPDYKISGKNGRKQKVRMALRPICNEIKIKRAEKEDLRKA